MASLRRTSTQSAAALAFLSVKSEESGAPRGARTLAGGKPVQAICHLTGRGRDGMNGDVQSRGSLNRVSRQQRKRTGIASLSNSGWRETVRCVRSLESYGKVWNETLAKGENRQKQSIPIT